MTISIFDLYTIGIGPSSSHTVGPMRAARMFAETLSQHHDFPQLSFVRAEFFGSLGLTGKGHGSDKAVLLGLEGDTPEDVDHDHIPARLECIHKNKRLNLFRKKEIIFDDRKDLVFHRNKRLPLHSNGMSFIALDTHGAEIAKHIYYSIGGGFVVDDTTTLPQLVADQTKVAYPFQSAAALLALGKRENKKIYELVLENEKSWRDLSEIKTRILKIWAAMQECVTRGCHTAGILPGGLKVARRAPELFNKLSTNTAAMFSDPLAIMDWVNLYALAVNEENAAGGRVVTAPTNGAAGIIPAVLHYVHRFTPHNTDEKTVEFLLTAGAIGMLYKQNASISGAEVGCQGEVGVACSMAAAALTAVMGGTNEQIENAAEIGMEHNLGLTCDPIGGLVQIPCIERNAMGAMKAINAARIALSGDGSHKVSLDKVIQTMLQTGRDMQTKYKETSRGGLAINVVEC